MNTKTRLLFLLTTLFFCACSGQKDMLLSPKEKAAFIEDEIVTKSGDRVNLLDDNLISLWDGKKESKLVEMFSGYPVKIHAIAVSPDERYLAAGGMVECDSLDNNHISLYRYKENTPFKVLGLHTDSIYDLAFSSDGRYLVSAGADKSIKVWSMDTFELKQSLDFHTDAVYGVQMIKDADVYKLISVGYDGQIALHTYDEDSNRVTLIKSHRLPYSLKYIAYDKNKKELAVCGEAKEVTVYDLSLKHIKTIHTPMIPHRLRYGRAGKALLVGGGGHSSRIEGYNTSDYSPYY